MRNIRGVKIPNINDFIYYKSMYGILPGKVLAVIDNYTNNPTIIIEGHMGADTGKHIELLISEIKLSPQDWKEK